MALNNKGISINQTLVLRRQRFDEEDTEPIKRYDDEFRQY